MSYRQRIVELIEADALRMRALRAVRTLDLPDWLIAAGFVRNLVWDNLFGKKPIFAISMLFISADPTLLQSEIARWNGSCANWNRTCHGR